MKTFHQLDRMPTGIAGLDHLFNGGIQRGNSLLLQGPPGSGKTTLGVRIIHEGIVRYNEPGLIITFEEFPKQIYQESLSYGLDLGELEASGKLRIVWTTPTRILDGFTGKNDLIDKIVHETKVRRIAIDSVTHFKRVAPSEVALREVLANILSYLKIRGINPILIKELERTDEHAIPFEEYLVDASMRLFSEASPSGGEDTRFLEIRKSRGQPHITGRHPFVLSAEGPRVFPHLSVEDVRAAFPRRPAARPERVSTGVDGLDAMLSGGIWRPSISIVSGHPGAGKSVLAGLFIGRGLAAAERCMLVSLKRSQAQARQEAASLGMDWAAQESKGAMRILEFPTVGTCLERIMNRLLDEIREFRPHRILVDALDDLRAAAHGEERMHDFLHVFAALAESAGAATLLLSEGQPAAAEGAQCRSHGYNYLAETVIRLEVAQEDGAQVRRIHVAKHGGAHAMDIRRFKIGPGGIEIEDSEEGASERPESSASFVPKIVGAGRPVR